MKPKKPGLQVRPRELEIHRPEDVQRMLEMIEDKTRHYLEGGKGVVIKFTRPKRTAEQNDKMWPLLRDIARQVKWADRYLGEDDWKTIFTAALRHGEMVPGLYGGFVMIGANTSDMTKGELSDLIEIIYAFGADKGVEWSEEPLSAVSNI